MKRNSYPSIINTPNPFDESAPARLVNMGVLNKEGDINQDIMSSFIVIFTGLFFDDINDYGDAERMARTHKVFVNYYNEEDYWNMYLFISIQYDMIKKIMPDPIWLIAGNKLVVKEFMTGFMKCFNTLMADAGFIEFEEEADKK